ncbi:MAG: GNAT family N-acetyltransferase [Halieaceae bacterium]|nr:GNAT family N-acetyltransferase [Halieaceae bacterium]
MTEVKVWYLQQTDPGQHLHTPNPGGIRVEEATVRQFRFNRFLYELVGAPWQWVDKLSWSDAQWRAYAERDSLRTWAAWVEGSPAGYFELEKRADGSVDICYFGLAQPFIGRGLGSYFLSCAIAEAWAWDANRVTVNTCSLDHPSALGNYQSRGFEVYRTEVEQRS